jgi:hypothetical protein
MSIATLATTRAKSTFQQKWDQSTENLIKTCIKSSLTSSNNVNVWKRIESEFQAHYEKPATNMTQLVKNTRQESGSVFEHFCVMWLKAKSYGQVWLLGDVPEEILNLLHLSRKDYGIDIIIYRENVGYFAVQAKYRSNNRNKPRTYLTWNMLSTFYAMCAYSGPWLKYIVMTNCDAVLRKGKKRKMDQTIARKSFENTSRDIWVKMAGLSEGYKISEQVSVKLSLEELRSKRLEWLSKTN